MSGETRQAPDKTVGLSDRDRKMMGMDVHEKMSGDNEVAEREYEANPNVQEFRRLSKELERLIDELGALMAGKNKIGILTETDRETKRIEREAGVLNSDVRRLLPPDARQKDRDVFHSNNSRLHSLGIQRKKLSGEDRGEWDVGRPGWENLK